MLPKVDLLAQQAIEAAAAARATTKRKKRLVVQPRGDAARTEVGTTPTSSSGIIPLAIPLVEVVGESASWQVCPEATGSHVSERALERICSVLLLGDIKRFERLAFLELVRWAYSFSNSVSVAYHLRTFSFFCICSH